MVTVCGVLLAPGAPIVTEPLAEIPLTVTVCCFPPSSAPLCGENLYADREPVAVHPMTPSPVLDTVNCALELRQTARDISVRETERSGCPAVGVSVVTPSGVGLPSGDAVDVGIPGEEMTPGEASAPPESNPVVGEG